MTDQDGVGSTTTFVASSSAAGYATEVATVTNGRGEVTSFVYDEAGHRTAVTTEVAGTTATSYDLRGHVTQVTAPTPIS